MTSVMKVVLVAVDDDAAAAAGGFWPSVRSIV